MAISNLSLFKRKGGVWYIIYNLGGRVRWKSTGQKMKSDALKVLHDFEAHLQKKLPSVLLSEFQNTLTKLYSNAISANTLRSYLLAMRSFQTVIGNKLLNHYTLREVESFKAKRLETCTPTTVNIEFRALRAAFNLAVKWQLLNENPFLQSSQVKTAEQLPTYLTREDFQKLLGATVEQVLKDVFLFAALTGLRLGEIINLKWQEVDLQRKLVTVGSASFQTKSGRVRVLPMGEDVYRMLLRRSTLSAGFVFHKNGYQLQGSFVSHKFKAYVRAVGLSDAIHFHSLRHTNATWLVQSGCNIYQVQKLLGHSSVKTTEVYSHLTASELHEVVNKIGFN